MMGVLLFLGLCDAKRRVQGRVFCTITRRSYSFPLADTGFWWVFNIIHRIERCFCGKVDINAAFIVRLYRIPAFSLRPARPCTQTRRRKARLGQPLVCLSNKVCRRGTLWRLFFIQEKCLTSLFGIHTIWKLLLKDRQRRNTHEAYIPT